MTRKNHGTAKNQKKIMLLPNKTLIVSLTCLLITFLQHSKKNKVPLMVFSIFSTIEKQDLAKQRIAFKFPNNLG